MLYDNALLARVYLHAWQVTGEPFYRDIAQETFDYVLREMTDPTGGFYSTQDADSEGEEGKFYVWTLGQIRDLLEEEAQPFIEAYGVTEAGNFEGRNILELVGDLDRRKKLEDARRKLLTAREKRTRPGRDEKVLVSWNGLMLAAFAEAARVLGEERYRQAAERNASFLLSEMRRRRCRAPRGRGDAQGRQNGDFEGRLWHSWQGGVAKINGYLEDHANLVEGLIELYQTTFEPRWYVAAQEVAEVMVEHFQAPDMGFYDTSNDHESRGLEWRIARPRELQDNAVPSGNAMAATILLRLGALSVEPSYLDLARHGLLSMQENLARHPLAFGQWLIAFDYTVARSYEVAIIGDPQNQDTRDLLWVPRMRYDPHTVVAVGTEADDLVSGDNAVPLLRYRQQVNGRATAHVCVTTAGKSVCLPPITDAQELERILSER